MALTPGSSLFAFGLPWALGLLVLLPALWWLLKSLPPPPRPLSFPPIRLLDGLIAQHPTPARMPLWLLILRLALSALLILCLAHPVLNPAPADTATHKPLLLVIDDGWAAASDWDARLAWLDARLSAAESAGRPVMTLTTAPQQGGAPPVLEGPMTASQARSQVAALQPQPWPTDRKRALDILHARPQASDTQTMDIEWLCDGIESDGLSTRAFVHDLLSLDPGMIATLGRSSPILTRVSDASADPSQMEFEVRSFRPSADGPTLRAIDAGGLDLTSVTIPPDTLKAQAAITLPVEMRNRIERVDLGYHSGAAGVWLMDESARLRTVGVFDGGVETASQPLLDAITYIAKALKPSADVRKGDITSLIAAKPAVIFTGDWVPPGVLDELEPWAKQGGMVVRFGGPGLTQGDTDAPDNAARLLPIPLMRGGRALGGRLSWTSPQHLAPFDDQSPFSGLAVPDDVTVTTQVLADPERMGEARVWAKLADGTPLVTARRTGRGWVVLFHVTATPDWSTLPLSGVFPAMLQRLIETARGGAVPSSQPLPPYRILDGQGRLVTPTASLRPASPDTPVGADHPPGLYGDATAYVAVNLGPAVSSARAIDTADIPQLRPMERVSVQVDLTPPLGIAAVILMLADLILRLWPDRRRALASTLLIVLAATAAPLSVGAAEVDAQAAMQPRLAYVLTGDFQTDQASRDGLSRLTTLLADRSTALLGPPKGLDPESAEWVFYPLVYWPVTPAQSTPSAQAVARVRQYLSHGGMILFDRQPTAQSAMRRLGDVLELPSVRPLPADHVLTRSFYLINATQLAQHGQNLWIEGPRADNDGVASVLISDGDWAGLWAQGVSDGTEMAFRFGVNLCMYALTGNYKADQVHMPAILERLGQGRQP